jgi:hypothetical protein
MTVKIFTLLVSLILCLCLGLTASAADFAGDWQAEMHLSNGTTTVFLLALKTEGSTLTGTLQYGKRNPKPLDNGAIQGNEVSFTVTEMSEAGPYKMSYKGKLEGNELKIIGERENQEGKIVKARDLTFARK